MNKLRWLYEWIVGAVWYRNQYWELDMFYPIPNPSPQAGQGDKQQDPTEVKF